MICSYSFQNTSRSWCRESYKSYLKCSSFQKERRQVLKEPTSEEPSGQAHSVQVMELPSTSEQDSTFLEISGDQRDEQMQTEVQPASEGPRRQAHSVQVMELPSTSEQDSTFLEINNDQHDVQMQPEVQEISKRQPEENISVTAADLPEVTNEKADPLLDGDDPVYPGAPLTKGQSLLLLMSYILRHNLTAVSVQHLLKIFNEHFPGMVPVTTWKL
ncbi:uncharacterized protein [Garra rufa]|uniref:uncharacterized protein n=1 Tax=Garra rufa TaxID=137080 RepID=UPI003CCE5729